MGDYGLIKVIIDDYGIFLDYLVDLDKSVTILETCTKTYHKLRPPPLVEWPNCFCNL